MDSVNEKSVKKFAEALKAQGKSPSTIEAYSRDARQFLSYLSSADIDPRAADPSILKTYTEGRSENHNETENSIRRSVIGIRQFYRHLVDSNIKTASPFDDAPIPQRVEKAPSYATMAAISKAFEHDLPAPICLKTARDNLIFCFLGLEGIKASEIINLKWLNVIIGTTTTSVSITGQRSRVIELSPKTRSQLDQYILYLKETLGGDSTYLLANSFVLLAFRGRDFGHVIPHMTRHGLKFLLYEFGSKIFIDHLNAEMLRHHAVVNMVETGMSPDGIMKKLGLKRLGNIKRHFQQPLSS